MAFESGSWTAWVPTGAAVMGPEQEMADTCTNKSVTYIISYTHSNPY